MINLNWFFKRKPAAAPIQQIDPDTELRLKREIQRVHRDLYIRLLTYQQWHNDHNIDVDSLLEPLLGVCMDFIDYPNELVDLIHDRPSSQQFL